MNNKEDCRQALNEAAAILGKSPSKSEYAGLDIDPSIWIIRNKYESWNEAKKDAKLETFSHGGKGKAESMGTGRVLYKETKDEGSCINCDENTNDCLDFHHVEPTEKDKLVCRLVNEGAKKEVVEAEIEKCVLVCSNCHRKHHSTSHPFHITSLRE